MDPQVNINFQQNTTKISIVGISSSPVASVVVDSNRQEVKIIDNNSIQKISLIEDSSLEVVTNIMDETTNSAELGLKGSLSSEQEWLDSIKKHVCEYTWEKNEW